MAAAAANSRRGRVSLKGLSYWGQPFSEAPQSKGFQPRGVWELRAQLLGTPGTSRRRADAFYWRHCWDGAIRCSSPGYQARFTGRATCKVQNPAASMFSTLFSGCGGLDHDNFQLHWLSPIHTHGSPQSNRMSGHPFHGKHIRLERFWTGQPDSLGQTLFPAFFSRDLTSLLASEVKIYFFLSLEKVILCPSRGYR